MLTSFFGFFPYIITLSRDIILQLANINFFFFNFEE